MMRHVVNMVDMAAMSCCGCCHSNQCMTSYR